MMIAVVLFLLLYLCMMLVISRNIDTNPLLKLSSKLLGSVERLYDAELLWPIL